MNADEFIKNFHPGMSEYCPVIITPDGSIYECSGGHLQTLKAISGDADVMSKIPKDESPLLYLTGALGCVCVDYENQIYLDELTEKQSEALKLLEEAGLICNRLVRMSRKAANLG